MPASLHERDADAPTEKPPARTAGEIAAIWMLPALLLAYVLLALALPCIFELPID
jgi:hypothetical protein